VFKTTRGTAILAGALLAAAGFGAGMAGQAHAAGTISANAVANGAGAAATFDAATSTWTLVSPHAGTNGSAQVDLINPGTATTAPTMTVDHEGAGNPRWVIEFHNGTYLVGYPAAGDNVSTLSWTLEPGGKAEPDYTHALADAQAGGSDDQVTAAFVVEDVGNPDTTVHLTNVTYDGQAVVKFVPPPVVPYVYGGHTVSVGYNDAVVAWKERCGLAQQRQQVRAGLDLRAGLRRLGPERPDQSWVGTRRVHLRSLGQQCEPGLPPWPEEGRLPVRPARRASHRVLRARQ